MIISGGRLLLTDKDPQQDLSLPIDHFFPISLRTMPAAGRSPSCSRAPAATDRAAAAFGMCMKPVDWCTAQSEETAKFDGMPKKAVQTGLTDGAISPGQMATYLSDYLRRHALELANPEVITSDVEATRGIGAIFKLLRDEYGIDFSYYKPNTVTRRIERRLSLKPVDRSG